MILDDVAIAAVVRTAVDCIKVAKIPRWTLPLLAIVLGGGFVPLLLQDLSWSAVAHGCVVGSGAVGLNETIDKLGNRFSSSVDSPRVSV